MRKEHRGKYDILRSTTPPVDSKKPFRELLEQLISILSKLSQL